jgi:hypothetical protein
MIHPRAAEIIRESLGLEGGWRVSLLRSLVSEAAPGCYLDDLELEVLWQDWSEKSSAGWLIPDLGEVHRFLAAYGLEESCGFGG